MGIEGIALEDHGDVTIVGRQMADRILVEVDFALGLFFQAGDEAQGGGLAAAGRPDQGHEFGVLDVQVQAVDSGHSAE